jgi:hypothetical protein
MNGGRGHTQSDQRKCLASRETDTHRLFLLVILLAYNSCTGVYTVMLAYVFKIYLSWI